MELTHIYDGGRHTLRNDYVAENFMVAAVHSARSYMANEQARAALQGADPRDFKQEWNRGRAEFHLKLNGYTEYIISHNPAAPSDSQYSARVRYFGRDESLSTRFGDLLNSQLRATFKAIADLRASQREVVTEAIQSKALLGHVSERESYALNAAQKGVLFTSILPDTGAGGIVVRGDLSRDMSHSEKRLILEVTWRSSVGTGGPMSFVVDRQYAQLLDSTR